MQFNKDLEQHIAVFGESGSGKTVMLSSFYGATQEPRFLEASLFDVTADDVGQGHRLHANYLGMKDSGRRPEPNRFSATQYAFSVRLRKQGAGSNGSRPFDALRLVWHDYPGEWFEKDVSGPEEAERRLATFRSLLGSDVAFLLVDGQLLRDNAGEEDRYLKSLLTSFRTGLTRLGDQLLDDGEPLARFPRIWVLALSKADLLPELDVFGFRDLVIEKASGELTALRNEIEKLVDSPSALSVGEDFVLISSAKFEPNNIEVAERIGLDLVLPLAAILPLERHVRWADRRLVGARVMEELLGGASVLATAFVKGARFAGIQGRIAALIGRAGVHQALTVAAELGVEQLKRMNAEALQTRDYLTAVLTQFRIDMDDAEEKRVLFKSKR